MNAILFCCYVLFVQKWQDFKQFVLKRDSYPKTRTPLTTLAGSTIQNQFKIGLMFDQVWLVDFFHGRFSSLVNSEILLLHFHFLSSSRWCEKRALHQKISTFALPTKRSLTPLPAPIDVQCSGINTCAGCQAPIHFFFCQILFK